jgi:hypothetical protein
MKENCDTAFWESILASEGLAPIGSLKKEIEASGFEFDSLENLAGTEHRIKESLDKGVEIENMFPSETPLNKCGLPPCQRAKLEDERSIRERNPKLED